MKTNKTIFPILILLSGLLLASQEMWGSQEYSLRKRDALETDLQFDTKYSRPEKRIKVVVVRTRTAGARADQGEPKKTIRVVFKPSPKKALAEADQSMQVPAARDLEEGEIVNGTSSAAPMDEDWEDEAHAQAFQKPYLERSHIDFTSCSLVPGQYTPFGLNEAYDGYTSKPIANDPARVIKHDTIKDGQNKLEFDLYIHEMNQTEANSKMLASIKLLHQIQRGLVNISELNAINSGKQGTYSMAKQSPYNKMMAGNLVALLPNLRQQILEKIYCDQSYTQTLLETFENPFGIRIREEIETPSFNIDVDNALNGEHYSLINLDISNIIRHSFPQSFDQEILRYAMLAGIEVEKNRELTDSALFLLEAYISVNGIYYHQFYDLLLPIRIHWSGKVVFEYLVGTNRKQIFHRNIVVSPLSA